MAADQVCTLQAFNFLYDYVFIIEFQVVFIIPSVKART